MRSWIRPCAETLPSAHSRAVSLQASQPMRRPGPPTALLMPHSEMPRSKQSAAVGSRSAAGSSSSVRYISSLHVHGM